MSLQQTDYALSMHTRWERALHGALSLYKPGDPGMTLEQRSNFVIAFCQKNPQNAGEIVYCEFCAEDKASALLNGKDPHAIPEECLSILRKWGYEKIGKSPRPLKK